MLSSLSNLVFAPQKIQHRRPSTQSNRQALDFSSLERRDLLASIVFDAASSQVTIYGSSGNDAAYVNNVSGGRISVAVNGAPTQQFNAADVDLVRFFANDGDDLFENNTAINSFFGAQGGNDTFRGGSGDDTVFGGDGIDDLRGNGGNDTIQGGDGADTIRGGNGDDLLNGNHGEDLIYGDAGDDILRGAWDNDTLFGGDGNDSFWAFAGDDTIHGGDGNDLAYGQHGNDTFFGGNGNDRLRGNPGNDVIHGDAGNDYLLGDQGDDQLIGGDGDDVLNAWQGNDTLEGNDGNDELFAGAGNDIVDGGSGNDRVGGDSGDDFIRGGSGNDRLFGQAGNDTIYGGGGADNLVGGDGDDSLFGGDYSATDTLIGNAGFDRFLVQANNNDSNSNRDSVGDATANDAVVKFINFDSNWTDTEIEVIDVGFQQLYETTGNVRLLQDSLPSGDIRFFKYGANSLNGFAGLNTLRTSSRTSFSNGQSNTTYTYDREIRIADWDETSEWYNDQYRSVALHELAHNWDGENELTVGAGLTNLWDQWLATSGWRESSNGNWSKTASSSAFAEAYGETNPYEDFATVWELYFSGSADSVSNGTLQSKLDMLDTLFAAI